MDGIAGRRVAITGIGIVGPCGIGRDKFWQGLLAPAPVGNRAMKEAAVALKEAGQ